MALKLITPPAVEPVSLADAKAHLRLEIDCVPEDALVASLIQVAREWCEGYQSRQYITAIWELWLDAWPCGNSIRVPLPPLQNVSSIKYYGADDTEHIMATANYFVDTKSEPGRLALAHGKSWPSVALRRVNGVCIEFAAGHVTASDVPARVQQAILLLAGHWYEHREAVLTGTISKEIEFSVKALLGLDRVVPV